MELHIPNYKIKTDIIATSSIVELNKCINDYLEQYAGVIRLIDIKYSSAMAPKVSRPGTNDYTHEYSAMIIYAMEETKGDWL